MNLLLRVLSAVILLPIVLVLLHLGGVYTFGLLVVVAGICFLEYGNIVMPRDLPSRAVLTLMGVLGVAACMRATSPTLAVLSLHLPIIGLAIWFTLRTGEFSTAWPRMTALAFGMPYVGLGVVSLYKLRAAGVGMEEWAAPTWLYVALLATWSNDTFAYFAGRAFGRHKLYEKVSPKKTWEGFAGGMVGSVLMLFVIQAGFPQSFGHFRPVDFLCIGVPAALLAPLGDLAESLLKRNYGVKDSGNTIPGHGGMLDRLDAVFFVAPWVLFYESGVRPLWGG
jgi:phosphatidate cytidylyltransferase